jgi:hypothetical protein
MLPAEDLLACVCVLVHGLMPAGVIVVRPGPAGAGSARPEPARACADGGLLAIAVVRCLLGRRSEAGFRAEVARDWGHLFPMLPHRSEASRRPRWLGGLRAVPGGAGGPAARGRLPEDDCPRTTASRRAHPRCRSGMRPGSAARASGPARAAARLPGSAVTLPAPSCSMASGWRSGPARAGGSCGPGGSCLPRSASARSPGPARGRGLQRRGVRRFTGRLQHCCACPARQDPARCHAPRPAGSDRRMAQPDRGSLRR